MESQIPAAGESFNEDSRRPVKIRFDLGEAELGEFARASSILSDVYNKLYSWHQMVSRADADSLEGTHSRQTPRRMLTEYATEVPPEDRLRITELAIAPVAYVAVTGAQKPLFTLEHYLAHRHVDWDRRAGKEPFEGKRLELEEQRIDAVREQFEFLRDMGFPENQIREALSEYIFAPLDQLDRCTTLRIFSEELAQASASSPGSQ